MRVAFCVLAAAFCARAHEPITTKLTWTQEISRIVYKRCAACHRTGGSAPMSLLTYDEARPWAKAIRDEVLERRMPPWLPVEGVGEFRDDAGLSQPEIDLIVAWVEGGAPKGEDIYLPPTPSFASTPAVSEPGGTRLTVARTLTLEKAVRVAAIRPSGVAGHGTFEAAAIKPDGAVERLIWIRDFQSKWNRDYVFSDPVALPRGTRIEIWSTAGASAVFTITSSPER